MNKSWNIALKATATLLATVMLLASCGSSETEFSTFTNSAGGYSVLLPVEGRSDETSTQDTDVGEIEVGIMVAEVSNELAYASSHTDFPEGVSLDLDGAVAGAVDGSVPGATLNSSVETTVDGWPCRQFEAEGQLEGTDAEMTGVICIAESRLFQIFVIGEPGVIADANTVAFIDSFTITSAG